MNYCVLWNMSLMSSYLVYAKMIFSVH